MKSHVLLIIAVALLLGAMVGERLAARHKRHLAQRRAALAEQLAETETRTLNAAREGATYSTFQALAREAGGALRYESDPTALLRAFTELAALSNVRLINSKMLSPDRAGEGVADGALRRIRFEMQLSGSYAPLVGFVDRIERAPQPMIIETLSMVADRRTSGHGQLTLVISALHPAPPKAEERSVAAKGAAK